MKLTTEMVRVMAVSLLSEHRVCDVPFESSTKTPTPKVNRGFKANQRKQRKQKGKRK